MPQNTPNGCFLATSTSCKIELRNRQYMFPGCFYLRSSNDISTTYTCKRHCLLLTRGLWQFWHCIMSFRGLMNNFSSLPSSTSSFTFLTKDHAVDHLVPILLSAGEVKRLSRRLNCYYIKW